MWKSNYRTVCQIVFCAVVALAISTGIAAALGIKITSTVIHPILARFILIAVHVFWGVVFTLSFGPQFRKSCLSKTRFDVHSDLDRLGN